MALQLTANSIPPYAGPPLPPDEDARVGALRTLQIEEGQADPVLDSLCNLVCSLLKVRIAGARPAVNQAGLCHGTWSPARVLPGAVAKGLAPLSRRYRPLWSHWLR